MTDRSQYQVLLTLLDAEQYEACRVAAERLIDQEVESPQPNDLVLAHQHLILSRALRRLHEGRKAAEAAATAAFLARKLKNHELLAEALFRAGVGHGEAGDYSRAVERLTHCLNLGEHPFTGRALYNRGLFHQLMGAYSHASDDYRAALKHAQQDGEAWLQACYLTLAWVLIVQHEFSEAEQVLMALEQEVEARGSRLYQLQMAHTRAHMWYLKRQHTDALKKAVAILDAAGEEYPQVRGYTLLTLMQLAEETDQLREAFAFGILSKRMAGKARRPDLDDEVSRRLRQLHLETGCDGLVDALLNLQQVLPGTVDRSSGHRRQKRSGGVA